MSISLCRLLCSYTRPSLGKRFLMSEVVRPQHNNRILAALPAEDYERLSSHIEPVELQHSQILYEAGGRMDYVYFPEKAMVSLISQLSDGSSVEVGITGYEGMIGISSVYRSR